MKKQLRNESYTLFVTFIFDSGESYGPVTA